MKFNNLHAILAANGDGLIGDGDKIPWCHPADLKHFKNVTDDSAIIIGVKTLIGIAYNYFQKKTVLPGRKIFVVYQQRSDTDRLKVEKMLEDAGYFDWSNVTLIAENPIPLDDLKEITALYKYQIFIAGGSRIYDRYMQYASNVYFTLISIDDKPDYTNPVYLSNNTRTRLINNLSDCEMVVLKPPKKFENVTAEFIKILQN